MMILRTHRPTIVALIAGLLTSVTAVLVSSEFPGDSTSAQALQSVTSLSVDECTEIDNGESVELPVSVSGVSELIAWEIYFAYDRDLLEVIGRDVRWFLSEGANSNVIDLSDPVPNSKGLYRLAAADIALNAQAETGGGVIATIILQAKSEGVSPAAIYRSNVVPLGPSLKSEGGVSIGDDDGDGIFDGSIISGQIAIGQPCRATPPTPDPDVEDVVVVPRTDRPGVTTRPQDGTGTSSPGPTDGSDGTGDPRPDGTGDPDEESPEPGDRTPGSGGSEDDDDDQRSTTPTGTERPGRENGGGGFGGSGIGSSDDNTFWAIVLIGGGVSLGLVATYFFARMTRKPV